MRTTLLFFLPFPINRLNEFVDAARNDLNVITRYHEVNGMKINPNKSKCMIISRNAHQHQFQMSHLSINDEVKIEKVERHKYLGVIIESDASLKGHVEYVIDRIKPVVNILSILKWNCPRHVLLKIYSAHVHSHLFNAAIIYGHATKNEINRLKVLQNKALKHAYKLPTRCRTEDLYSKFASSTLPVSGVCVYATLVLVHKIHLNIITSNLNLAKRNNGLRNSRDFFVAPFSSEFLKRDMSYYGTRLHNCLPIKLKTEKNIDKFKNDLKLFVLTHKSIMIQNDLSTILDELCTLA